MSIGRIQSDAQWTAQVTDGLPVRWKNRLLDRWQQTEGGKSGRVANIELRETVEALDAIKLPLDANDDDIRRAGELMALGCLDVARIQHTRVGVAAAMFSFCRDRKIEPPGNGVTDGAIKRMTCADWWARQLRKLHARTVEGAAIQLGYVNRARDCYVSNESLERRRQQNRRNALMMENTLLRNEEGAEFTLAELAAKGTANKAIRRGELMTRIAGFERIALDCGHEGLFLTVTCPSRMHKWICVGKKTDVAVNKKYDDITPKEAQAYLSTVYARTRSALARAGLGIYGFRVAEPHHDGCPHWHMLFFHEQGRAQEIIEIFKKYALADSPDEAGAQTHRVKAVVMDASKGSAASYIAKYVAKNIDGMYVGNDLCGNPAMETSGRVEAWAATWGIRQFQQIGGAPVGVWRELRRVKDMPEGAPEALKRAHHAVNRIEEGEEVKPAAWDEYIRAQGGALVGRKHAIKLESEQTGELGRYGELMAARPVGVSAVGFELYSIGRLQAGRLVEWLVKSVRHAWEVVRGGSKVLGGAFPAPWTCVNNCTREGGEIGGKFGGNSSEGGRKLGESSRPYQDDGGGLCFTPA